MAMTFDTTLKDLGRDNPTALLTAFDRPPQAPVKVLNADLSAVTTAADLILGIGDPLEEIVHLDFQASAAAWKHADILVYNALTFATYHVPVHTIVVLLRPQAAHANLNGVVRYAARPERGSMHFSYEIVCLWERLAADLLTADLGAVPLAVLGKLPDGVSLEDGLAQVIRRLAERVADEAAPGRAQKLLLSAFLLTGLRVKLPVAKRLFGGIPAMYESETFLGIIDEGREKEVKKLILRLGARRFGAAEEAVAARLNGISDLERLERIFDRILDVAGWQDLLDTP